MWVTGTMRVGSGRFADAVLTAVLIAAAFAPVAFAQSADAQTAVDEGRFADAVERYERLLDADPDDVAILTLLARTQVYWADDLPDADEDVKRDLYDAAVEHAERATELAPDDPDAVFEVARSLGRTAQYRGVFQSLNLAGWVSDALERTLELDPDHASAWHALALYHHEVPWIAGGRAGEIDPAFERAIELEPNVIFHRVSYAEVLLDRDRPEEAAAQLEAALALEPTTYLERREHEEARALHDALP
ncbi:MAG: TRAP transporter TatT component family protein [Trueperaceae bacterium]